MAKMKANPNDELYQCAKAYKSMTDRDVTYRIEMVVPEKTEDNVRKLLEIKTYTFALRDYNFKHLTGIQHFSHPNITDSSKILLNDCINGSTNMSTFNGRTYSAGRDGFGFSDRLETLKNFEVLMDNLPKKNFAIHFVDKFNSNIKADYVISFQESTSPIGDSSASEANAYRNYLFVKNTNIFDKKGNVSELNGMSCFTDTSRDGNWKCDVLSVVKIEKGNAKQLFCIKEEDRTKKEKDIILYNIDTKAKSAEKDILQYRKDIVRKPNDIKKAKVYEKNLHCLLCNKVKYSDAVLLNLRDKLEKKEGSVSQARYEKEAIEAVLITRKLEQLEEEKTGELEDFLGYLADIDGLGDFKTTVENWFSEYGIQVSESHISHIMKIASYKENHIEISDDSLDFLKPEDKSADTAFHAMQDVIANSDNPFSNMHSGDGTLVLDNRLKDRVSELVGRIRELINNAGEFLKDRLEEIARRFHKQEDTSQHDTGHTEVRYAEEQANVPQQKESAQHYRYTIDETIAMYNSTVKNCQNHTELGTYRELTDGLSFSEKRKYKEKSTQSKEQSKKYNKEDCEKHDDCKQDDDMSR